MKRAIATSFAALIAASTPALADEPVPPPEPTTPTPPATPATPPATPAEPPATAPPATLPSGQPLPPPETESKGSYSKRTIEDKPAEGASLGHIDDTGGSTAISKSASPASTRPTLVAELSGSGAYVANPYVEYKGWTLETGQSKGMRLEGNFLGILVAYEVSSLANEQACADTCYTGNYGSTRFHALEAGYRYRFGNLGPVRPFIAGSLGAVLATQGSWTMKDPGVTKGAIARGAIGIEIPLPAKLFASASVAYRLIVTENPYRDPVLEAQEEVFVGGDRPNGDYAEDIHLIAGYVGIGMEL